MCGLTQVTQGAIFKHFAHRASGLGGNGPNRPVLVAQLQLTVDAHCADCYRSPTMSHGSPGTHRAGCRPAGFSTGQCAAGCARSHQPVPRPRPSAVTVADHRHLPKRCHLVGRLEAKGQPTAARAMPRATLPMFRPPVFAVASRQRWPPRRH